MKSVMLYSIITDRNINLTPLIRNPKGDNSITLNYGLSKSENNMRNRKLRESKRSGKNTIGNRTLINKNNNIEKKPKAKLKQVEYRKVKY